MTRTIDIPTELNSYADALESDHVIEVKGARNWRFGLGAIPRGGEGRKVTGGPLVPGPWAFAFGLATVIDRCGGTGAENERLQLVNKYHVCEPGDVLVIDGVPYRIELHRDGYNIELVPAVEA